MNTWRIQGLRYIIVGLASNAAIYFLYLVLTSLGLGHKLAMSLLYVLGTLQTFVFNKRWTFSHRGDVRNCSVRYFIAYATGYVLNLALLHVFVDRLGLPHQVVQGIAIIVIAVILFLAQKYWVFRPSHDSDIPQEGLT